MYYMTKKVWEDSHSKYDCGFFSKACNAQDIFQTLQISQAKEYDKYRNQFPVIHISFNEFGRRCSSYEQYIDQIEKRLVKDLKM